MRRQIRIAVALATLGAALSLLLPYQPVYDPWGWLVWGRELAHLDLATAAGPSWKPLPALIDVPLSLLGGAAPEAWLLLVRAGALMAPLLAGLLAARLAGPDAGRWRWAGAALAAASVALGGDTFTPPVRQFTGGLSEPLLVALVLGALWLALDGRSRGALWLGALASLLRPECWPFLALWAWREARRDARLRPHAIAAALLILLAWFLPDMIAAGNPLEGSETARRGGFELDEIAQVAERALLAPLAAIWIGVALFLLLRRPSAEGDRALTTLLLAAVAWVVLVAAMAVIGFAGLPRFLAPASAAFAVVGGVGVARAGAAAFAPGARRTTLAVAAAIALFAAAGGFALRAAEIPGDLETVERRADHEGDLFAVVDRVGAHQLRSCGGGVRMTQLLPQTSLAWQLELPIELVEVGHRFRHGIVLSAKPFPGGRQLSRVGAWRAVDLGCRRSG